MGLQANWLKMASWYCHCKSVITIALHRWILNLILVSSRYKCTYVNSSGGLGSDNNSVGGKLKCKCKVTFVTKPRAHCIRNLAHSDCNTFHLFISLVSSNRCRHIHELKQITLFFLQALNAMTLKTFLLPFSL